MRFATRSSSSNAKSGEQVTIEMLSQTADPNAERLLLFYKPSLERLGITVTIRNVDEAQYENRLRSWDYDMIISSCESGVAVARQ